MKFLKFSLSLLILILVFNLPTSHSFGQEPPIDPTKLNATINLLLVHRASFINRKIHVSFGKYNYYPTLRTLHVDFDTSQTLDQILSQVGENDLVEYTQNLIATNQVPYIIIVNDTYFYRYFRTATSSHLPKARNAFLKIVRGQIYLVLQKNGKRVLIAGLKTNVNNALTNHLSLAFSLGWEWIIPDVTNDETEQARLTSLEWLNRSVKIRARYDQSMRLKKHNRTYTAVSGTIGNWIYYVNEGGVLVAKLSRGKINLWLGKVARIAKVKPINRIVAYRNGHRIIIRSGWAGQRIIVTDIYKQIVTNIKAGLDTYIPLDAIHIQPKNLILGGIVPGRYKGRYLELSLHQQKMYVFYGYRLLHIFRISSGRPSMPTPSGRFRIVRKNPWSACRPSWEYYTCYMPFSMYFTWQGNAIHALPIINGRQEGIWHLGIPISHGCVRLLPSAAVHMYYTTPIGTPVVIHW
jgi:hypothetical protein